jgi:GMP synthase (glutamine-hydrolysing)
MKPFLILQLRPETEASDDEFFAILNKGGLSEADVHRVRLDCEDLPEDLDLDAYSGVIVGGGPGCISDPADKKPPLEAKIEAAVLSLMPAITARDFPFMGCCYGIGILTHHLGAEVSKRQYGEPVGTSHARIEPSGADDPLLAGLPAEFDVFVGHKEAAQELPQGCAHLISSAPCPYQMIRYGENVYATQFHPEADASGFETRIIIYKHRGYFPPQKAEELIAMCRAADVTVPETILKRFVDRYRATSA